MSATSRILETGSNTGDISWVLNSTFGANISDDTEEESSSDTMLHTPDELGVDLTDSSEE